MLRSVDGERRGHRPVRPLHALAAVVACVVLAAVAGGAGTRPFDTAAGAYHCPTGTIQTGTDDAAGNGSNCAYQLAAGFPLGGTGAPSLNATMVPSLDVLPVWKTTQGAGVTVALLETGVDAAQPDLRSNVLSGSNMYDGTADTSDQSGHGTILASIIAAAAGDRPLERGYEARSRNARRKRVEQGGSALKSFGDTAAEPDRSGQRPQPDREVQKRVRCPTAISAQHNPQIGVGVPTRQRRVARADRHGGVIVRGR